MITPAFFVIATLKAAYMAASSSLRIPSLQDGFRVLKRESEATGEMLDYPTCGAVKARRRVPKPTEDMSATHPQKRQSAYLHPPPHEDLRCAAGFRVDFCGCKTSAPT
jgi:hypothetical protein